MIDKFTGEVLLTEEDLFAQHEQEPEYIWEDVMFTLFPNACSEADLDEELDNIWND